MQTLAFEHNPLRPASESEYAEYLAGGAISSTRLDDRTLLLSVPLPAHGGGIVSSTLCYVFIDSRGAAHIVDPGWDTDENFALLQSSLADHGIQEVATVTATHLHPDHLGMANRVRRELGAELFLSEREWEIICQPDAVDLDHRFHDWGIPQGAITLPTKSEFSYSDWEEPDRLYQGGEVLDFGHQLEVVDTPGHSQGSVSFVVHSPGWILTGDHVMPHRNPGLGLGYNPTANPVGDYFEAAESLLRFKDYTVFPGHGYRFNRLDHRIREHISHHLLRTRKVAEVIEAQPQATVWEVAQQLSWSGGWDQLLTSKLYLPSVLSQTHAHMIFVNDAERSKRWLSSSY